MIGENSHTLKSFIGLIIGVFFAIIISELILQILNFPSRPISGWLNCNKKNPGQCNQLGFRGREIAYSDDDFVVILLGDSEAYAPALPFEQMPERRLEHYLKNYKNNVKVFTVGDMGYGQDQQYLALKKYFEKYRADLVLLMFTVRNDIEDNMFPVAGFNNTIKPTFWLENDKLRGPSEGWLKPIGLRLKLALIWKSHFGKTIGESLLQKWKKEILPPRYQGLRHYEGEVDYSWQKAWNTNRNTTYNSLEFERAGNSGTELTPRSELRIYGINLTRKLFSKIKQLVETNHGHFIIFKEERSWELEDIAKEKVYYLNGKYYKLSLKQHHDTLKDLFYGFEHYRISLNMKDHTVTQNDEHLNQQTIDNLFQKLSEKISNMN